MTHLRTLSKTPVVAQTTLAVKLNATLDVVDRLLLAQAQSAWKVPFPLEGGEETDTTTTTDTIDTFI